MATSKNLFKKDYILSWSTLDGCPAQMNDLVESEFEGSCFVLLTVVLGIFSCKVLFIYQKPFDEELPSFLMGKLKLRDAE